jgi:hypothetical protein
MGRQEGPFLSCNPPENKSQKVAYFSAANLLSLSTTFSPQNHHDLPSKNHAKYAQFRKTPSKNTSSPTKNKKEDPETVLRFRGHRSADGP